MDSTPNTRLREWREFKGISITEMFRRTGVKVSTLSQADAAGASSPSYDTLTKVLLGFPDLSPEWLMLGTGPMLRDGRALTPATNAAAAPTETTDTGEGPEPGPAGGVMTASRTDLPEPGNATPAQADFVGRLIDRLEQELEASKGREVYWQERAERLEKPSPAPDAAWLSTPRTEIRKWGTAASQAEPEGKLVAMWPQEQERAVAA